MKRYIVVIFLGIFASSVSSSAICSFNQELNKDTAAKLSEFRNQTYSICQACTDNACLLKTWPEEKKGYEAVCKLLFWTPSYVSKFFEKPDNVKSGKTKIEFSYIINSKGKIKEVEVKSARGAMNARESYKYLQSFTSKTQFEPLLVNDNAITLIDIRGEHIGYTGKYASKSRDLEKLDLKLDDRKI